MGSDIGGSGGMPPQENLDFYISLDQFWCILRAYWLTSFLNYLATQEKTIHVTVQGIDACSLQAGQVRKNSLEVSSGYTLHLINTGRRAFTGGAEPPSILNRGGFSPPSPPGSYATGIHNHIQDHGKIMTPDSFQVLAFNIIIILTHSTVCSAYWFDLQV